MCMNFTYSIHLVWQASLALSVLSSSPRCHVSLFYLVHPGVWQDAINTVADRSAVSHTRRSSKCAGYMRGLLVQRA